MKLDCILLFLMCLPFVQPAHETTHKSDKGGMIRLPWETQRNEKSVPPSVHPSLGDIIDNRMIHDSFPTTNPFLGETIAAVSPSEVRTLSDNTDVSHPHFDPQFDFPRRHWRRRRPFWRRRFFNPDTMPDLLPEIPRSDQGLDTTRHVQNQKHPGLHSDKGTPHTSQTQKIISAVLPGLEFGNRNIKQNERLSANQKHGTMIDQPKFNEQSGLDKKKKSDVQSTGLLNGILQKITEKVASNIVDKLVDRVMQNNQMQSAVLPGNTQSSSAGGRGFSNPFTPNSHVHGTNGEVIPVVHHRGHIHTHHGQTIPVNNPMTHGFGRIGHRNSWNQNPFLHRAVQNSPRGWVHG